MFYTEMIRIIGTYTLMWSWTADERYCAIMARRQSAVPRSTSR